MTYLNAIETTDFHTRHATIVRMAEDLIALGPFDNSNDAVEALLRCHKYRPLHVAELFEEARAVAVQERVAKEMSDS